MMRVGVYYYPEQWPRKNWVRDLDRIASLDFKIVHLAEFAWFQMEPSPGQFEFGWLDEVMRLCAERRLEVILCTPTAAPPIWLAREHPDTLPLEATGVKDFGGRRHYSPTSPEFRAATTRIVTQMAQRYGQHPSVIGWQIDNEYSGNFTLNGHTHEAFQAWLRARYGTIAELNRAWANQFWNNYYTDFSQVRMVAKREPAYSNPHHHMDASRFWSDAWADFNRLQCDILRPHIGQRFLTTNFMPFHPDTDPGAMRKDLSLFSWDSYPLTGWNVPETPPAGDGPDAYRLADPDGIAIVHRQMSAYTGQWALMELQPGQLNWSGVPVTPYPGAVRLWIWTALAMGSEFVTVYRWRQPLWGVEQFHGALVNTDGATLSPAGEEFAAVARELKRLNLADFESAVAAPQNPATTVGLVLDWDQFSMLRVHRQATGWDQQQLLTGCYTAAARLGLDVKILLPGDEWPKDLKLVMAPGLQMVDDALVSQLTAYAQGGGHLFLTCRTGLMNREGHLFEAEWGSRVSGLTGARLNGYDGLPATRPGRVDYNGKHYAWHVWGDRMVPLAGTTTLGVYADQFYSGEAAIVSRTLGTGTVTTCGVYAGQDLMNDLVADIARSLQLQTVELPPRVRLARQGPITFALNYNDRSLPTPAAKGVTFMLGGETLPPAGVAIWR